LNIWGPNSWRFKSLRCEWSGERLEHLICNCQWSD
jgi:hypothetical protein